jgi:hypothetical protein
VSGAITGLDRETARPGGLTGLEPEATGVGLFGTSFELLPNACKSIAFSRRLSVPVGSSGAFV